MCYAYPYPMNTKKILYFLVILLFLAGSRPASAASSDTEDNRYFVQTTKGFWKNTLGARNSFEDGFTANLSAWQLRFAKLAGLKVYPVKKLNILPAEEVVPVVANLLDNLFGRDEPQRLLPAEQVPWGVKTLYADTSIASTSGGAGVSVAVLDTGINGEHPDLKRRVKECKDFTAPKVSVADGKCDDKNGHGTHVAGIIAADGGEDKKGIYGMAPESDIFAYKVCSANGSCWSDDIASALRTAVDNGAQIVNLSLGSDVESSLITDAVAYAVSKGVLVVAAAGNDGPYIDSIDYPAADAGVVAVGALDSYLSVPEWSSRGNNSETKPNKVEKEDIELSAPGVNIESAWKDGGYVILSGTSMASPHVAGLAAKLWQKNAEFPAEATRGLLHRLAHDLLPLGEDNDSGFGIPTL